MGNDLYHRNNYATIAFQVLSLLCRFTGLPYEPPIDHSRLVSTLCQTSKLLRARSHAIKLSASRALALTIVPLEPNVDDEEIVGDICAVAAVSTSTNFCCALDVRLSNIDGKHYAVLHVLHVVPYIPYIWNMSVPLQYPSSGYTSIASIWQ